MFEWNGRRQHAPRTTEVTHGTAAVNVLQSHTFACSSSSAASCLAISSDRAAMLSRMARRAAAAARSKSFFRCTSYGLRP
eukprot:172082-Chlamydomonas_euryale.AAC.1